MRPFWQVETNVADGRQRGRYCRAPRRRMDASIVRANCVTAGSAAEGADARFRIIRFVRSPLIRYHLIPNLIDPWRWPVGVGRCFRRHLNLLPAIPIQLINGLPKWFGSTNKKKELKMVFSYVHTFDSATHGRRGGGGEELKGYPDWRAMKKNRFSFLQLFCKRRISD